MVHICKMPKLDRGSVGGAVGLCICLLTPTVSSKLSCSLPFLQASGRCSDYIPLSNDTLEWKVRSINSTLYMCALC